MFKRRVIIILAVVLFGFGGIATYQRVNSPTLAPTQLESGQVDNQFSSFDGRSLLPDSPLAVSLSSTAAKSADGLPTDLMMITGFLSLVTVYGLVNLRNEEDTIY